MRRTIRAAIVLSATALVPIGVPTQSPAGPDSAGAAVPCSDGRGCPDLVVSAGALAFKLVLDERTNSPHQCSVIEGEAKPGLRRLLRFNFVGANVGAGDLIVGKPEDHPELYDFGTCHGHPHFKDYADYRLWTPAGYAAWLALRAANPNVVPAAILAANPKVARQMVAGRKQGFCVADRVPCTFLVAGCPAPDPQKYEDCNVFQGISVGWADVYDITLDGQWVEVDSLQGTFVLEAEINAERLFEEASYANNSAAVCVNIPARDEPSARPPTPGCIDPTPMQAPTTCELCLFNCAGVPGCDCTDACGS